MLSLFAATMVFAAIPPGPVAVASAQTLNNPGQTKPGADSRSQDPTWNSLTAAQQQALKPLGANWASISAGQKRKWIEISRNFPSLSAAEQAKMHSRMAGWVALTAQQRAQARLNYAESQKLPPDEKKAKWQAYQALSAEEKQRLAANAQPKAGAAPGIKPTPSHKLAVVPPQRATPGVGLAPGNKAHDGHAPRIAAAPYQVDGNTLLPQQAPLNTPVQQR